jgi:hypothetical protein
MAGARAMGAARYAADGAGRSHRASFPASRDRPTSLSGLAVKDHRSVARGPSRAPDRGVTRGRASAQRVVSTKGHSTKGHGARWLYRERLRRQSGPQPGPGIDGG